MNTCSYLMICGSTSFKRWRCGTLTNFNATTKKTTEVATSSRNVPMSTIPLGLWSTTCLMKRTHSITKSTFPSLTTSTGQRSESQMAVAIFQCFQQQIATTMWCIWAQSSWILSTLLLTWHQWMKEAEITFKLELLLDLIPPWSMRATLHHLSLLQFLLDLNQLLLLNPHLLLNLNPLHLSQLLFQTQLQFLQHPPLLSQLSRWWSQPKETPRHGFRRTKCGSSLWAWSLSFC